ncbi:hypothetical protein [Persephonella sp.]
MKRYISYSLLLSSVVMFSCGDDGSKDPYINPYVSTVSGEVTQQSVSTLGYQVDGKELQYISAFSMENGRLVYASSIINTDGTFKLNLKKDLKYSFVIFDKDYQPLLNIKQDLKNVFIIKGDTYVRIVVKLNPDGTIDVADLEHDQNTLLDWDDLFDDLDGDEIPDFAESDNDGDGRLDYDEDGDGIFDGIEDKNNNSYIDGSEDTDRDLLPDPIDDDDDNDGIPDDQDDDDDNDGIPDDQEDS